MAGSTATKIAAASASTGRDGIASLQAARICIYVQQGSLRVGGGGVGRRGRWVAARWGECSQAAAPGLKAIGGCNWW